MTTFSAQNFGARKTSACARATIRPLSSRSRSWVEWRCSSSRSSIPSHDSLSTTPRSWATPRPCIHFIAPFYLFYSIVDNTSGEVRGSGEQPAAAEASTVAGTVVFRVIWLLARRAPAPYAPDHAPGYPVTRILTASLLSLAYHHFGHRARACQETPRAPRTQDLAPERVATPARSAVFTRGVRDSYVQRDPLKGIL